MKKLILFLIAFSSSLCFAEGPIFRHKDARTQLEFENAYQDLRKKDLYMSIDGTYVCIDNPTFCVDRNNNEVRIGSTTAGSSLYVDSNGIVRQASQPSFLATISGGATNVTGNNTIYTMPYATEIKDLNSDYNNSTYIFTAPVTGLYSFCASYRMTGMSGGSNLGLIVIETSNRQYRDVAVFPNTQTSISQSFCVLADMDANDTVYITVEIDTGALTADLSSNAIDSIFSGSLIN